MSFVRPSFSHIFLNRRSICSADSVPRALTLIMQAPVFSPAPRIIRIPEGTTTHRAKQKPQATTARWARSSPWLTGGKCTRGCLFFKSGHVVRVSGACGGPIIKLPRRPRAGSISAMTIPPTPPQPQPAPQPGQPAPVNYTVVNAPPTNGLGLAGSITSLVGIVTCGVLSPVGLLLSLIGLLKSPRGFAVAGTVLGLI